MDESNLKALEREIALQQLSELPHQTPRQRVFRGKTSKPVTPTGNNLKEKPTTPNNQENISKDKNKENSTKPPTPHAKKEHVDASPRKQPIDVTSRKHSIDVSPKKQPVEIEPQVKVNMVLKTYSRKRKISEPQDPLKDYPPPKKPVYDDSPDDTETKELKTEPVETVQQPPSPVYVTKSSRVIKKKVIWDPDDDLSTRSPKPAPKQTATDSKSTVQRSSPAVKTVKTDKNSNNEKVVEKKVAEKKTQEKKVEKTPSERKVEKTPPKKSPSPKSNSGSKPKKLRSEIDRLLMDEGKH